MLLSTDHKYLAILTETSVHVIDISRMEMLRSKQAKVIAKLSTAYDGILGDSVKINRLVRVRWHPYIPNLLVFLTSDGRLQFCRLTCSSGGSLKFENELVVNLDASHAKSSFRVNLNEAMGTVYMDFDFGSPLFLNEARFAQDALLRVPVYTLCENGDIQLVSASPMAVNHSLVRVVRILPANEDYYTFDFDTLMCLRSADREDQPDVVCFANRGGRIFHGVCLHIPPSVLLQSNSRPQSCSVPVLYLIDSVDLDLLNLEKSFDTWTRRSDGESDVDSELDSCSGSGLKLTLVPAAHIWSNFSSFPLPDIDSSYFCIHNFGIHRIRIPWMNNLREFYSSATADDDSDPNLLLKFRSEMCSVDYLLLTQSLKSQIYDERSIGRAVIGLLPGKTPSVKDDENDLGSPALTIVFGTKPGIVTIPLAARSTSLSDLSFTPIHMHRCVEKGDPEADEEAYKMRNKTPEKAVPVGLKESNFVKNCRRNLKAAESARLPIMSSLDDGANPSELEFFRLFLKATELYTSQMSCLAGLAASVRRYAESVEGVLAVQSEEVAALADARNALHTRATELTDRHAHILERQEALNHRLSELARRIYSVGAGLTDAEEEMRRTVRTLRDRLKSGLLGWLENIRFQHDHLAVRLREHQQAGTANITLWSSGRPSQSQQPQFSSVQVRNLVSALKVENCEIDALVKAAEKINLASKFTPPLSQTAPRFNS
ncbi:hypothetical protein Aperf_G00000077566 [Anoplocephala perfoliata]